MKIINLIIVLLIFIGCSPKIQPTITFSDTTYNIQIANTQAARTRGLMNVPHMDNNQGMLFVFEDEQPRSFWMKNTLIPLDLIFLNKNFEVVEIKENFEPCLTTECPSYTSQNPSSYVLELNAGEVSSQKINVGNNAILNDNN